MKDGRRSNSDIYILPSLLNGDHLLKASSGPALKMASSSGEAKGCPKSCSSLKLAETAAVLIHLSDLIGRS